MPTQGISNVCNFILCNFIKCVPGNNNIYVCVHLQLAVIHSFTHTSAYQVEILQPEIASFLIYHYTIQCGAGGDCD